MQVTLLDDIIQNTSPPPSPTLISLHDPTPVRRLIASDDTEDDGILAFELNPTSFTEHRTPPRKSSLKRLNNCSSALCPSATSFVPRASYRQQSGHETATAKLSPKPRIRTSGTTSASPLLVVRDELILSSAPSPSPTKLPSRTDPSGSRPFSPRLLFPATSPALSRASSSFNLSRSPSLDPLPELGYDNDDEDEDGFGDTPPTSLSSRGTPIGGDEPDIVVTSEEDVAGLFTFDFKPASWTGEEKILIDLGDTIKKENETGTIVETYEGDTEGIILAPKAKRHPGKQTANRRGAAILSVRTVEDSLIDPLPSGTLTRTRISSPAENIVIKRIEQPISLNQIKARADNREDLLVDLSESGMGRNSPDRFFRGAFSMAQQQVPHRQYPVRGPVPKSGPSRRKNGAVDVEGQLIDVGVPLNRTRDNADAKSLRQRMKLGTDPSGNAGRPRTPPVSQKGIPAVVERYAAISPYHQLISRKSPRQNIPPALRDMGMKDPLQHTVMKAWQATEPPKGRRSYVLALLEELSVLVNQKLAWAGSSSAKGKRRFEVDVFGSVSWGGETGAGGDLDLVVLVSSHGDSVAGWSLIIRIYRCHLAVSRFDIPIMIRRIFLAPQMITKANNNRYQLTSRPPGRMASTKRAAS